MAENKFMVVTFVEDYFEDIREFDSEAEREAFIEGAKYGANCYGAGNFVPAKYPEWKSELEDLEGYDDLLERIGTRLERDESGQDPHGNLTSLNSLI